MDQITRDLLVALRDAISEAHDTHIYAPDDPHPNDCHYCSLIAQTDALLLAHPVLTDQQEACDDDDKTPATFTTTGNWGNLVCDIKTGNVVRYDRENSDWEKDGDGYDNITRLDADEWRRTYPSGDIAAGHDILDFGSWDTAGVYVGPEWDWRFNLWRDRESYGADFSIVPKLGPEAAAKYQAWLKQSGIENVIADYDADLPTANDVRGILPPASQCLGFAVVFPDEVVTKFWSKDEALD